MEIMPANAIWDKKRKSSIESLFLKSIFASFLKGSKMVL